MANEDKAVKYHRLKRRAAMAGVVLPAIGLVLVLVTGASVGLRAWAAGVTGRLPATALVYVVVTWLALEVLTLPLAFYDGVVLERRYGLLRQTVGGWVRDHAKAAGLSLVLAVFVASVTVLLLHAWPDRWWIVAAIAFTMGSLLLALVAPVVLLPLFYDVTPLTREALRTRLVALAERAGTRVLDVFEWRLSDRTRKANAALTGLGRTRRIMLSDTLLADHPDDEIEVILAHELAHHVHRDMWKGLALESLLIGASCWVADQMLTRGVDYLRLQGKADPAGLPLLVLGAGAVSLLLRPLANALSRAHERRADRYALEMTHNVSAFVAAMRRLSATNLSEERPSKLVELLFHSHPPVQARIAAAQRWEQTSPR